MNIRYLNDGCKLNNIADSSIREHLESGGYTFASRGGARVNFCGLVTYKKNHYFFFPKTVNCDPTLNHQTNALGILQSIAKYNRENSSRHSIPNQEDKDLKSMSLLSSAMRVIDLWKQYGILQLADHVLTRRDSGTIDWSSTISRLPVELMTPQYAPIYTKPYIKKYPLLETMLTKIHLWCVAKIDRDLGWLLNHEAKIITPELRHYAQTPPCSIEHAVRLLKQYRQTEFAANKVRIISSLIDFLSNESASLDNQGPTVYGVNYFSTLWEAMCAAILKNKDNSIQLPKAVYKGTNFNDKDHRQIPDIIIREDNDVFIIDAKYYDITNSRPGISDIIKQFFYQKSVSIVKPNANISNYFLFPKPYNTNTIPQFVEMTHDFISPNNPLLRNEFPNIECIYVDVLDIVNKYNNSNSQQISWNELHLPKSTQYTEQSLAHY